MAALSRDLLHEHYAHILHLARFPEIEKFMSERPVILMVLQKEDAVNKVRELIGPTDSKIAEKGTIRGDLGDDMMRNVVHASDSVENANMEINRFFSSEEVFEL